MTPVEPTRYPTDSRLVVFAADQPEYQQLPAAIAPDGIVMTEWEPTAEELDRLFQGGRIRIWIHTFGAPLQPIMVIAAEPECGMRGSDLVDFPNPG